MIQYCRSTIISGYVMLEIWCRLSHTSSYQFHWSSPLLPIIHDQPTPCSSWWGGILPFPWSTIWVSYQTKTNLQRARADHYKCWKQTTASSLSVLSYFKPVYLLLYTDLYNSTFELWGLNVHVFLLAHQKENTCFTKRLTFGFCWNTSLLISAQVTTSNWSWWRAVVIYLKLQLQRNKPANRRNTEKQASPNTAMTYEVYLLRVQDFYDHVAMMSCHLCRNIFFKEQTWTWTWHDTYEQFTTTLCSSMESYFLISKSFIYWSREAVQQKTPSTSHCIYYKTSFRTHFAESAIR